MFFHQEFDRASLRSKYFYLAGFMNEMYDLKNLFLLSLFESHMSIDML